MTLRRDPLAAASEQLRVLHATAPHLPFDRTLAEAGLAPLQAAGIQVLQVNVGRVCNQTCVHCHVDAGPDRRESMSREVAEACLHVLDKARIRTLDITGGAPEMNPSFRHLVTQARRLGRQVIDRSNLTILEAPGFRDLPEFLAENGVEIVASLPCYSAKNVDAQRGGGVFDQSIAALRRLNAVGYGQPDSGRMLTLVYNPGGPSLPPPQATLEADYKRELQTRYGVLFNRLFTLTNLPIGRFLHSLVQNGQYDAYMQRLVEAFNPAAVEGVMCRTTLSVEWNGRLHDCDFNQMLGLGLDAAACADIREFDLERLAHRRILTGPHCYGCTAGAGSSCQGALLSENGVGSHDLARPPSDHPTDYGTA
jgi:radical SAM/Cys-rich protein